MAIPEEQSVKNVLETVMTHLNMEGRNDSETKSTIKDNVGNKHLKYIKDAKPTKEMMESLKVVCTF